jgi:hypothetical protein
VRLVVVVAASLAVHVVLIGADGTLFIGGFEAASLYVYPPQAAGSDK